jgi:SAM-dependent methyltransferase
MPITAPFEEHTDRYEGWFEAHPAAHESELAAIRHVLPAFDADDAAEVGVGSGQFAAPLGVGIGVDPSPAMLERAEGREIDVIRGVGETLPLRDESLSLSLLVTTVCFLDDLDATLAEVRRVLRPEGTLAVGFVDRESPLGRRYQSERETNPFYRDATFVSVPELEAALQRTGFREPTVVQTLFSPPEDLDGPDRVETGWGEGSFVALAASVSE